MVAIGRAFRISEKDIKAYKMTRRPKMRSLRKNPLGVTAIMGVANGRGAYGRFKANKMAKRGKRQKVGGITFYGKAPAKHVRKGATRPEHYALPEGYRYPIHGKTPEVSRKLVKRALSYYGRHKGRYSPQIQRKIELGIAKGAKAAGVSSPKAKEYRRKFNINRGESMLFRRNKKKSRTAKQKAASSKNLRAARAVRKPLRIKRFKVVGKKSGKIKRRGFRTAAGSAVRMVHMRLTSGGRIATQLTRNRKGKTAKRRSMPSPVARVQRIAGKRVAMIYGAKSVSAASYKDSYRGGKKYIQVMAQNRRRRRGMFRRNDEFAMMEEAAERTMDAQDAAIEAAETAAKRKRAAVELYEFEKHAKLSRQRAFQDPEIAREYKALKAEKAKAARIAALAAAKAKRKEKAAAKAAAAAHSTELKKRVQEIQAELAELAKKTKTEEKMKKGSRKSKKTKKSGSAPRSTKRGTRKAARKAKTGRRAKKTSRKAKKSRKLAANRRRRHLRRNRKSRKAPRKARKSRKARKHTGRKHTRRALRRNPARRYHRKHMKANRKRSVFGRRLRRNFSFATLKAILPRVGIALGGFVAHKFLTKLLVGLVGNKIPYAKTLLGAAVAAGGFFAAQKFLPKQSDDIGLGMLVSFAEGAVREVVPTVAPMLGLGATASVMPRYTLGSYFEAAAGTPYLSAAAGSPYLQAAAGEYFSEGGSVAQLNGAGEYFASEIALQGTGDYEVSNNFATNGTGAVIDGVRPDSNLNAQFNLMEAAAGLGASPTGERSIYIPHENAQMIGAGQGAAESGIFDQNGSNGVLS